MITATGLLHTPKMPKIFEDDVFNGHIFHAARWDYAYTGGSHQDPRLVNLREKTVGVIGTGATAVQIVPLLSRWCKKVVVSQRTPPSIHALENKGMNLNPVTNRAWWDINFELRGSDWLKVRKKNFNAFVSNEPPPVYNEVQDAWTGMPSLSVLIGGPRNGEPGYLDEMQEIDCRRKQWFGLMSRKSSRMRRLLRH